MTYGAGGFWEQFFSDTRSFHPGIILRSRNGIGTASPCQKVGTLQKEIVLWDQTVTAEWLKSLPSQEWASKRKLPAKAWLGWELEVGGRAEGGRCTPRMAAGPKRGLGPVYWGLIQNESLWGGLQPLIMAPKIFSTIPLPYTHMPYPPPCLEEKVFF